MMKYFFMSQQKCASSTMRNHCEILKKFGIEVSLHRSFYSKEFSNRNFIHSGWHDGQFHRTRAFKEPHPVNEDGSMRWKQNSLFHDSTYKKVGIIRNPHDLLASYYHQTGNGCNDIKKDFKSFREFILHLDRRYTNIDDHYKFSPLHVSTHYPLYNVEGILCVDYLINISKLNDFLYKVTNIDFSTKSDKQNHLKLQHKNWLNEIYDNEMNQIVNESFSFEIKLSQFLLNNKQNLVGVDNLRDFIQLPLGRFSTLNNE